MTPAPTLVESGNPNQGEANMPTAITVYKDGSWIAWQAMDAHYAENEDDWLVTIPLPVEKTPQQ